MATQTSTSPNFYALLIGIDFYFPNKMPEGRYRSLGGCVSDITRVESYLKGTLKVPSANILKLLARDTGKDKPSGPTQFWPTYENMVKKFEELTNIAQSGDQVYIHYSGHGGRASTAYPEKKGSDGVDEALVPTDIGKKDGRYLRDLELAYILKRMVDKGLIITVVLDSCHSGGATRGVGDVMVRGLSQIDKKKRPTDSLVASKEELMRMWSSSTKRNLEYGSGWLPEPEGYTLLAACLQHESAVETAFDGLNSSGALTYWLLDSLRQFGANLSHVTYKALHNRIIAKIHTRFEQQTPQLEGVGDRIVFGSDRLQLQHAVNVMKVEPKRQKVLLNAGQPYGARKGALFAIYPSGQSDFTQVDQRLALVKITKLGATESEAEVTHRLRPDAIVEGCQAVLLDPGATHLKRRLELVYDKVPKHTKALQEIEKALANDDSKFVIYDKERKQQDMPLEFQVAVNAASEYEILDVSGTPITNLRPAIKINEPDAAKRVLKRLIHLTKYRNVRELDNYDSSSPLADKLLVELMGKQSDYEAGDKPNPKPFDTQGNTPVLKPGEYAFVRIKNLLPPDPDNPLKHVLNITVLDLQPDWGIGKLYPTVKDAAMFFPLDPGKEIVHPLRAGLPADYKQGTDVIKVIATIGAPDFSSLLLEALDQPPIQKKSGTRKGSATSLDQLLEAMTADEPAKRHLEVEQNPSQEWVTKQVEVRVEHS